MGLTSFEWMVQLPVDKMATGASEGSPPVQMVQPSVQMMQGSASALPTMPGQVQIINGQPYMLMAVMPYDPQAVQLQQSQHQQQQQPSQQLEAQQVPQQEQEQQVQQQQQPPQQPLGQQWFSQGQQQGMAPQVVMVPPEFTGQMQMAIPQQMPYCAPNAMAGPWVQNSMQCQWPCQWPQEAVWTSECSTQLPHDDHDLDFSYGQEFAGSTSAEHRARRHGGRRGGSGGRGGAAAQASADASVAARLQGLLAAQGAAWESALAEAMAILREPGIVRRLAFHPGGCRILQQALDCLDRHAAVEVAYGLQGSVASAVQSPHANYVVQKIIKALLIEEVPFIVEELSGAGLDLARHEYGCRIFCRLIESGLQHAPVARLVDELLLDSAELVCHTFGHHVAETALEHGLPRHRRLIADVLHSDLIYYCRDKSAAHVVEKALHSGEWSDKQALAEDLLRRPVEELAALSRHQFGGIVVRSLQRVSRQAGDRMQQLPGWGFQRARTRGSGRRSNRAPA